MTLQRWRMPVAAVMRSWLGNHFFRNGWRVVGILGALWCLGGCGRTQERQEVSNVPSPPALSRITLQTDWLPQPEQGGFYQALALGYYRDAGLEVEILPGGPNSGSLEKVLTERVDLAMNRADTLLQRLSEGLPLQLVMTTLQHDLQALLLHKNDPLEDWQQLDGRTVMASPGSTWITFLEKRYGIRMQIIPHEYSLQRFAADPTLIQQCLLTNEPIVAAHQGLSVRTLRLRDAGFDPPHLVYGKRSVLVQKKDAVGRFVQATRRGWESFLENPAPALGLISERNAGLSAAVLAEIHLALRAGGYLRADHLHRTIGDLDEKRLRGLWAQLRELGLLGATDLEDEMFFSGPTPDG